jgi:superfamily I DNA and/or RNA helicase
VTANILPTHFDYIFIDECASTIEPISIIPIALLGASSGRISSQIVLAGDHKQLQVRN